MCGIFGLIQSRPFDTAELHGVSQVIRHRGPDDEGFALFTSAGISTYGGNDTPSSSYDSAVSYCPSAPLPNEGSVGAGGVMLGHRRLSILDLSAHGHQPMVYRQRYWMTYNGEVYNYLELRAELQAAGYSFTTHSDSEVILAAYDRWGPDCLRRFNGMWGIAIYDTQAKTLFLARDRFGVKPIYLRWAEGRLAFASEIKAFTRLKDWQARGNVARVLDMLVWNLSDHTPETMFEGIVQLPAGHYMLLDVQGAVADRPQSDLALRIEPRRWYTLPEASINPATGAAAAEQFRELLDDAVRLRLRADVKVGSCLSGGLDSSAIVSLMGHQLSGSGGGHGLHTFNARSHDPEFDESRYASAVAVNSGAHSHSVTPEPGRLFEDLGRLAWHQDEPFVSTSIFAQWCVFQLARETGITVMLDGQGADEILCGYRGFFGAYLAGLLRQGRLASWGRELANLKREVGFSPLRSLGYTAAYLMPGLLGLLGKFDNRAYADRSWLLPAAHGAYDADPLLRFGGRPSSVRDMSVAQVTATNLPMLLHWEDRNSMAFSVEARVPFLDYRVVEFCLNLADSEKLGGGVSKSVLRRSMRGTVPDLILDRRDKLGFVTAEKHWLIRDMAPQFRLELVTAVERLDGLLAPTILAQFDRVVRGEQAFDHRYWRAISTGRWAQAFDVDLHA